MKTLINLLLGALICYFVLKYQDHIASALPYSVTIEKMRK
jgi:hypothetical protein